MLPKTVRDFETNLDALAVSATWAQSHRFSLIGTAADGTRQYVNDEIDVDFDRLWYAGFPLARTLFFGLAKRIKTYRFVSIQQAGSSVHFETWLQFGRGYRRLTLHTLPPTMGLEGGGLRQKLERWETRGRANPLLVDLGQPVIR